jgi:xanthine dehydrogenase/oxidase
MAPGVIEPISNGDTAVSLASLTADYDDTLRFYLNGTKVVLDSIDPEITLLEYLRGIGLTGTKLGCAEGGCGACTVVVSQLNPTTNKLYHASVNACLAPLVSVDGKHVITVEGIGSSKKPHPAQQRIAVNNGSQCGFCTPGIVMSLYALLRNNGPHPSEHDVEEAFDGNLCRCTGYRPILDAAQSFAPGKGCGKSIANGGSGCCMDKGGSCGGFTNGEVKGANDKKFTPPSFIHYDKDTELIFPPALRKHQFKSLALGNKRKKWLRPATLRELLEIKSASPQAKLIGGSTETQIETKFKAMDYNTSVYVGDIAELRQYSFHDEYLEIGGNIALTDLEAICDEATNHYGEVKSQSFAAVKKAIRYFAGRQIRNVGTPAGNLATASPISDLNPVFVATNSTMIAKSLKKTTELPMDSFFRSYRKTALPEDAVIAAMRIPVTAEKGEYIRTYKQAKRKDDDIAIVNACLRVALDDRNIVKSASLVYGGMAPITIAAKNAMEYLGGKHFSDLKTLEGVMGALEKDFNLPFGVPGGMATYRRSLAIGFFYRFYHDVLSGIAETEKQQDKEAIEEIERELSTGKKDHDASIAYSEKVMGKGNPHLAALKQCTGEAQYTDDIPHQKNELIGRLVLSTKAHAKLLKVDPAPALDMPGVVAWVDRHDVVSPEANWWGAPVCDEVFFAEDEVFTAGQPIGMVLATSAQQAEAAARKVLVTYEELPAIYTIEEAVEQQSFFEHYRYIKKGDVEKAFAECDHVISGTTRMGGQEHFYLETNATVAIPKPEDGEMEIWSSTQNTTETQAYAAQATGVANNKIVAKVKRLGVSSPSRISLSRHMVAA